LGGVLGDVWGYLWRVFGDVWEALLWYFERLLEGKNKENGLKILTY